MASILGVNPEGALSSEGQNGSQESPSEPKATTNGNFFTPQRIEHEPGHDTRILRAEKRTKQAESRTEQAKTRIEQAEARTEQAEARTEQAVARTEQAEARTEQAESRTEQAKTRTEQAEMRTEQLEDRNEEVIRASEVTYRRLFEAATDGILILDAETGRVKDVNPFLSNLLGFTHSEMLGKTMGELSPFKDIESNQVMLARLRDEGYLRYEDLPLETKDGRRIAAEFISNVYESGNSEVIQCNIRDVTERKKAEAEILRLKDNLEQLVAERTAELQFANEELQAFSYSVSHDLRAPLRHVRGFVELLQKDCGSILSEKNKDHLYTIDQAAGRMGDLIDDLLAFSRIGRQDMQKTDVDLTLLVQDALRDFETETKTRNINWVVGSLPNVRADKSLLRMVLINLLSNAVKFTGKCDHPKIEVGWAPNEDGEPVIFIRDNGAGFDPRYASKLFGVFQRLHSERDFEGTGIGLANVQRIINRHGGRVWAEGAVNQGATFNFSIPEGAAKPKSTPKSPIPHDVT